jgi:hypothetical protein
MALNHGMISDTDSLQSLGREVERQETEPCQARELRRWLTPLSAVDGHGYRVCLGHDTREDEDCTITHNYLSITVGPKVNRHRVSALR